MQQQHFKYGTVIDPLYNPFAESTKQLVSSYFDNPEMIKTKSVNGFSIYMNKVYGMLCNESRYIVATIQEDGEPMGFVKKLSELNWSSFQTRTSSEKYPNMKNFVYEQKRNMPYISPIKLVKRETNHCEYACENLPLNVTLIVPKGKSMYEYQAKGTIASALETFNTILTIRD